MSFARVKDLAGDGFPLLGGRLDVVGLGPWSTAGACTASACSSGRTAAASRRPAPSRSTATMSARAGRRLHALGRRSDLRGAELNDPGGAPRAEAHGRARGCPAAGLLLPAGTRPVRGRHDRAHQLPPAFDLPPQPSAPPAAVPVDPPAGGRERAAPRRPDPALVRARRRQAARAGGQHARCRAALDRPPAAGDRACARAPWPCSPARRPTAGATGRRPNEDNLLCRTIRAIKRRLPRSA